MLHIVNETEKEFKIAVVKGQEGRESALSIIAPTETEELNPIVEFGLDAALESVAEERINSAENGYEVKAKRSTKFFISEPDHITMYKIYAGNDFVANIESEIKGLDKNAYKAPKSVIVIITGLHEKVSLQVESEEEYDTKSDRSPVFEAFVETPIDNEEAGVSVHVFFCNYSKWQNIQREKIYITLPCENKLLFGSVDKVKDGKTSVVNALIRCDESGNVIRNEKKQNNGGGNRNNRGKGKKNFGKRGSRGAVTKDLPRYQNM